MASHPAKARARAIVSLLLAFSVALIAQTERFSATPEYQGIQAALLDKNMTPSRFGSGEMLRKSPSRVAVTVTDVTQTLNLETSLWRVEINKISGGVAVTNKQAGITWRTALGDSTRPGISWATDADAIPASRVLPLMEFQQVKRQENRWTMAGKMEGRDGPAKVEIAVIAPTVVRLAIEAPNLGDKAGLNFNITGEGPFFGLGERFGQAKLDGQRIAMRPYDKLGTPGHDWTYIPAPFLFTPRGLGLYLDTTAQSVFDLTQASRGQFAAQLKAPSVDCYFFIGDPKQMLGDYTSLTGRVPLPPPWAFGVWLNSLQGSETVLQDAQRLRQQGVPATALWILDLMDDQANLGFSLWTTSYYGQRAFSVQSCTSSVTRCSAMSTLTCALHFFRSILPALRSRRA